MAKKDIDLAVVLHDDCDYKDWLVELKERFYSHRLKASCATNGYLLDFYWKLGRDIEAKQYTNTYGSGFYKNLSQDLIKKIKITMPSDDVVQAFEKQVDDIYGNIRMLLLKNKNLAEQRDMLLPRLMSGKLEV